MKLNGILVIDTDYDKATDRHIVVTKRHQFHSINSKETHVQNQTAFFTIRTIVHLTNEIYGLRT